MPRCMRGSEKVKDRLDIRADRTSLDLGDSFLTTSPKLGCDQLRLMRRVADKSAENIPDGYFIAGSGILGQSPERIDSAHTDRQFCTTQVFDRGRESVSDVALFSGSGIMFGGSCLPVGDHTPPCGKCDAANTTKYQKKISDTFMGVCFTAPPLKRPVPIDCDRHQ